MRYIIIIINIEIFILKYILYCNFLIYIYIYVFFVCIFNLGDFVRVGGE